jgi:hypothetical protein
MRLCFLSKQTSSGACFCLCVPHSRCPLPFCAQKSKLKRTLFSPVTFPSNSPANISKTGSGAHVLQIMQTTVLGGGLTTVKQSSSNPCANNTITVSIQTNVPIFSWYFFHSPSPQPSRRAIPPSASPTRNAFIDTSWTLLRCIPSITLQGIIKTSTPSSSTTVPVPAKKGNSTAALRINSWNRETGIMAVNFESDVASHNGQGHASLVLMFDVTNPSMSQEPSGVKFQMSYSNNLGGTEVWDQSTNPVEKELDFDTNINAVPGVCVRVHASVFSCLLCIKARG